MAHTFTEDDEGKTVVNNQGDEVGIIADVEHGTAYVDPDPGVTDKIKSKLGWDDRGEDTYPLQEESVDSVTDDEIRLGSATTAGSGVTTGTVDTTSQSDATTSTADLDTESDPQPASEAVSEVGSVADSGKTTNVTDSAEDEWERKIKEATVVSDTSLGRIFQTPEALELAAEWIRLFYRAEYPLKFILAISDHNFGQARRIVDMSEEEFDEKLRNMYDKSNTIFENDPGLRGVNILSEEGDTK